VRRKGLFFLLFVISFFFVQDSAGSKEKITIGAMEEVILLPWGVKLPARIDTGASTTSLDARELKIENDIAVFRLLDTHSGLLLSCL